ncbi:MAG TPA: hypothetical protein V6D18_13015 [Thermosynechococcaceae cyanobacterium]
MQNPEGISRFAKFWKRAALVTLAATTIVGGLPFYAEPASAKPAKNSVRATPNQSSFSLAIVQKQVSFEKVVARVSLKPRQVDRFLSERFVGDFEYKLKGKKLPKAKFLQGLRAGDRVVVRLFTPDNRLIGYTEFDLLSYNSAVTLVLPDRAADYGILRTVQGVDVDGNYQVDRVGIVYDYFTQVTQASRYQESRVSFLSTAQNINYRSFTASGLPAPRPNCTYPVSFQSGSYSLVNRTVQTFQSGLSQAIVATPGQLVQIVNVSTTNVSVYQVRQQIATHRSVGVVRGDNDRDDDRNNGRRDRDDDDDDDDDD